MFASAAAGQSKNLTVRTAYSALSAGIGTLWLTQEDSLFKKHGLDSNLIYIRGGTTAVQALLAGEIQFAHLSPAPMLRNPTLNFDSAEEPKECFDKLTMNGFFMNEFNSESVRPELVEGLRMGFSAESTLNVEP